MNQLSPGFTLMQVNTFEPIVRGVHVIGVRDWVDRRRGEGWLRRVAKQYDPDWPEDLARERWYRLRPMLRALEESLRNGETVEQVIQGIMAADARNQLLGLCEGLEFVGYPARSLVHTERLLRELVNFGEVETLQNRSGLYEARIGAVPRDEVEWLCGVWLGLAPAAMRLLGARESQSSLVLRERVGGSTHLYLRCVYRC